MCRCLKGEHAGLVVVPRGRAVVDVADVGRPEYPAAPPGLFRHHLIAQRASPSLHAALTGAAAAAEQAWANYFFANGPRPLH